MSTATIHTNQGAIELELIYRQPLQGPLTLTFDSITLNSGETIHGPWVFTLSVG